MPRNILVIILLILALFALGTATFYFTLKEKGEKIEKEEKTATLPKTSQTKKVSPEPEKIVTQPQEPTQEPTTTEPIDTPDWKVYRNEKYGVEFKYPSGYKIEKDEDSALLCLKKEKAEDCGVRISFSYSGYLSLEKFILTDNIYLAEDPTLREKVIKGESAPQFIQEYSIFQANEIARDIRKISIDNREWISFVDTLGEEYKFYTQEGNIAVSISTEISQLVKDKEFQGILASIKFFEPKISGGVVKLINKLSPEERDKILKKMFPNEVIQEGQIRYGYPYFIILRKVLKGNFSLENEGEELLAIAEFLGASHVELLSHFFLAVFDKKYKLLSQPFYRPVTLKSSRKQGHFANDVGEFAFYRCSDGQVYFLFVNARHPNVPWTAGGADLIRFKSKKFETLQEISSGTEKDFGIPIEDLKRMSDILDPSRIWWEGIVVKPYFERIAIYKQTFHGKTYSQKIVHSHDLLWNPTHCRFEYR